MWKCLENPFIVWQRLVMKFSWSQRLTASRWGPSTFLSNENIKCVKSKLTHCDRSAFATFTFGSTFFTCIDRGEKDEEEDQDLCKVMVRSLLLPFRSLSCLEKTVENCSIEINNTDCKLLIGLKCRWSKPWILIILDSRSFSRHTVSKKFSLGMLESDPLRAVYDINQVCVTQI